MNRTNTALIQTPRSCFAHAETKGLPPWHLVGILATLEARVHGRFRAFVKTNDDPLRPLFQAPIWTWTQMTRNRLLPCASTVMDKSPSYGDVNIWVMHARYGVGRTWQYLKP